MYYVDAKHPHTKNQQLYGTRIGHTHVLKCNQLHEKKNLLLIGWYLIDLLYKCAPNMSTQHEE